MTEYRLLPVEATQEMIEAACTFETWGWGFTRELDREAAAATYAAMLSAAPPAPTREEVARIIDPVVGCDRSDVPGLRHEETLDEREADAYAKADAILALLGRQS
jgi:hypothetical protein